MPTSTDYYGVYNGGSNSIEVKPHVDLKNKQLKTWQSNLKHITPNESRNPMVSFMALQTTVNQESIKNTRMRLKNLNTKITLTLDNGKSLVKGVLHNSYWKYKHTHFKQ